jgi:5-methylcytosine-specific restriction endonuclease McrA
MADYFRRGKKGQKLRERLHWAQSGLCPLCRKPIMDISLAELSRPTSPGYPTFDHVLPIARGGADIAKNVLLTHRKCNAKRGSAMPSRRLVRLAHWVNEARQMRHRLTQLEARNG